jgi:nucleoside-diphosphate-sugar epimerase
VGVLPEIDAIVHLAARVHVMHDKETNRLKEFRRINSAGTECLARQAAKAGVRRFVYVSSVKVNGERTFETPFRELDEPRPEDAYALSKWEAEQALQRVSDETGLEIVIVRPPLVYGPGVKGNFLSLLRLVKSGVPLPLASVNNRRSFVSLDNLIALIVTCLEHPRAAGEVFLAADGEDLSTPELIRCIARSMGKTDRLFRFPAALLQAASRVVGKKAVWERLCGSLAVDASKAKKVLGWEPVSSVDEAMNKMTRWYVESQADRRIADASVSGK